MRKLVLDVGGTKIKYALMENDATIFEKGEVDTPLDHLDHLLDVFKEIYSKYQDQVDGMALSMPGNIDSNVGYMYSGGALMYNQKLNIIEAIQKVIPLPISVENDGKCAALAELWKGNLVNVNDGIVIILGTGIGGGVVQNGKLNRGNHFFAGEFSFIQSEVGGFKYENCFALKASTSTLLIGLSKKKGIDFNSINGYDFFNYLDSGDQDAMEVFDEFAANLAFQIYNFQCVLDPQRVLIGGGISKRDIVIEKVKEHLNKVYEQIPVSFPTVEIDHCKFYNDSNLIGALYHYFEINPTMPKM